jgi:hypothetical protein
MKKLIVIATFALLASCGSKPDTAADAAATGSAMETAAATPAPVQTPTPGSYDTTTADGTKGVSTLIADGTYVQRDAAGKVTAKGKWAVTDGKTCFTPESGAVECFSETARAADGSFSATDAKGAVTLVKPHAK